MLKCFEHKTTFPDTHRHFRLANEISRNCPTVCGYLELTKRNFKSKTCLNTQPVNDAFKFIKNKCRTPIQKSKGYRMHSSELRFYINCAFDDPCFLHMGYKQIFQFSRFSKEKRKNCFVQDTKNIYIYT